MSYFGIAPQSGDMSHWNCIWNSKLGLSNLENFKSLGYCRMRLVRLYKMLSRTVASGV